MSREYDPEKAKDEQKRFYERHPEKREEYKNRYKGRYKGRYKDYQREYYLKNRERTLEARRVGAIAYLSAPLGSKCEKCGSIENLERHHPDYSKILEINTLCRSCHKREHYIHPIAKESP